uniref:Uncharacterized protein n=1 Tax=Oryza nivara TaxID=4536 RepID=A0A0E0HUJ5_ORYNI
MGVSGAWLAAQSTAPSIAAVVAMGVSGEFGMARSKSERQAEVVGVEGVLPFVQQKGHHACGTRSRGRGSEDGLTVDKGP